MTGLNKKTARTLLAAGTGVVVLLLLAFQLVGQIASAGKSVGYYLVQEKDHLVISEVIPGLPAEDAGVEAGDVLLRVGSVGVRDQFDYDQAASSLRAGETVDLGVLRDGKPLALNVVPGVPWNWRSWVPNAFAACVHIALAVLVLASGSRTGRERLLVLLLVAIAVELSLPLESIGQPTLLVTATIVFWMLNGLQFGAELHLASLIPGRHDWFAARPWLAKLYYVLGIGFGLMWITRELSVPTSNPLLTWLESPVGDWVTELWFLVWPVGVVVIITSAALRWRDSLGRQQAALILLGLLPWAGLSILESSWTLRGTDYPAWLEVVEPLVLVLYPVAIFVTLFRYQLFDFELIVKKSLVYTALTTGLLLVFYAALGASGAFLSTFVDDPSVSIWVVAGATLVLGLLFSPLRRVLEEEIERRFFPERETLRHKLSDLSADLPKLGKIPAICDELVNRLTGVFAAQWSCVLIREGQSGLLVSRGTSRDCSCDISKRPYLLSERDPYLKELRARGRCVAPQAWQFQSRLAERFCEFGAQVVLPVQADGELRGVLLLGGKAGGEDYPSEEIELLNLFSHHFATILENARLFESATIDGLTRLLRREPVLAQLQKEMSRARRYRRPLSVGLIDVDDFKLVNDRSGHLMGDLVLQRVATVLNEMIRQADIVGRFGGDEFVVVLPETSLDGGRHVGEVLRSTVESLAIEDVSGLSVPVTVSVGVACLAEGTATDAGLHQLLADADRSLYQAKAAGKNAVRADWAKAPRPGPVDVDSVKQRARAGDTS